MATRDRTVVEYGQVTIDPLRLGPMTTEALMDSLNIRVDAADVLSPNHYKTADGMEAWDVIDAFGMDYFVGSAFKYLARAGKKNGEPYEVALGKAIKFLEAGIAKRAAR